MKPISFIRRSLFLVSLLWSCGALATPPAAQQKAADVYTVKGVEVDHSSTSSAQAKAESLKIGQKTAFEILLKRLALFGEQDKMTFIQKLNIDEYIRDFSVDQERHSDTQYTAQMTFRFHPQKVKDLLKTMMKSYTEVKSAPILVLPFLITQEPDQTVVQQRKVTWHKTWQQQQVKDQGLIPYKIINYDTIDRSILASNKTSHLGAETLEQLRSKYKIDHLMVAILTETESEFSLKIDSYKKDLPIESFVIKQPNQALAQTAPYILLLSELSDRLNQNWKQEHLTLEKAEENKLRIFIPIKSLEDWLEINKKLTANGQITAVNVNMMNAQMAVIDLNFKTSVDLLKKSLIQDRLNLHRVEAGQAKAELASADGQPQLINGYWIIERTLEQQQNLEN